MSSSLLWIHEKLRQFEGVCRSAEARLVRAATMREVVQAMDVHAAAEISAMRHTCPAYRRLTQAGARRLEELLTQQISALSSASLDVAETLFTRYQREDWQALRGQFGHLYRKGDAEARKLLHQKRSAPVTRHQA